MFCAGGEERLEGEASRRQEENGTLTKELPREFPPPQGSRSREFQTAPVADG